MAGFNLYVGTYQLNYRLILFHATPAYSYHVTWTKRSHFTLEVLLTDGRRLTYRLRSEGEGRE